MRLKTNKLNFYVEDEVREKLEKLAKESGLTMTAVISKLIMNREIKPLPTEELCRIYKELILTEGEDCVYGSIRNESGGR